MSLYQRMQQTAGRLLGQYKQGAITYTAPGTQTGPAYAPVFEPGQVYPLDATASGVGQQYRGSTLVIETDKEVTAAVFGVTPSISGTVTIDDVVHQIVLVQQVPAAGLPVAWKLIVRA